MNIGINGFGRIGRAVFKIALEKGYNVVAINDLTDVNNLAYLLRHDSVYGVYDKKVEVKGGHLVVNGKTVTIFSEKDPINLPWGSMKVDVVIESTGIFRNRDGAGKHLKAGAKYVLITAPADEPDVTIVPGVNEKALKKTDKIISVASCTTNCLAPTIKVLHENFGVERALINTVHAYTNDQVLHDQPHKKWRRGRAAATNMVPTSSGASEAISAVLPELKGRVDGLAIRVPVICGSLLDLTVTLKKPADKEKINSAFKKAALGELKGILEYSEDELVSSDVIHNTHSAIFDSLITEVNGNMVKVFAWYDNEYGYSNRVIDVVKMLK